MVLKIHVYINKLWTKNDMTIEVLLSLDRKNRG